MSRETISVIVPVYNVEKYVEKCLRSLMRQTYAELEILCIDDKSTDNSAQICEKLKTEDSRIRLIRKKRNTGLAAVRNLGLKKAAGAYVAFVDSDDWVVPDYLETLHGLLTAYEADIAQGSYIRTAVELDETSLLSGEGKTKCMTGQTALRQMFSAPMVHPDVEYTIVPNKLYRKSLLEGISFPEGKIFEDQYFSALCFYKCRKVAVTDQKIYFYRKNPQGTTMQKYSARFLDEVELHERLIGCFEKNGESDLAAMICARGIPLAIANYYQAESAGCADAGRKAYLHVLKGYGRYLGCGKVSRGHKWKTLLFLLSPSAFANLKLDVGYRETVKQDLLQRLEAWLADYDHVYLVPGENGKAGEFASDILRAGAKKTKGRRLLLLSAVLADADGFTCIRIDREEEEQLRRLYHMYEFADHFSVIAKESAYGGLYHLVETGVLSMEEAAEALFMR